jgi:hypothetical protein
MPVRPVMSEVQVWSQIAGKGKSGKDYVSRKGESEVEENMRAGAKLGDSAPRERCAAAE